MKKVYNKLVRDNIPSIIEKQGMKANYRVVEDDMEFILLLSNKLIEEAKELKKAIMTYYSQDDSEAITCVYNEVVDVEDVFDDLRHQLCLLRRADGRELLNSIMDYKHGINGAFNGHIFLESVEMPVIDTEEDPELYDKVANDAVDGE